MHKWFPPEDLSSDAWAVWASSLPLFLAFDLRCLSVDPRTALFVQESVPLTPNPNGAVNGGIVVAIADQAMAIVATRQAKNGHLPATASLHTQFHAPALAPLRIEATLLGGGRRVTFVEAVIFDRHGERCATTQGTFVTGASLRQVGVSADR